MPCASRQPARGTPSDEAVALAASDRRALARRVLASVSSATLDTLDALRAAGHPLGLISNATAETAEAWPDTSLPPSPRRGGLLL
ncbi:HAD family hydrolase [Micromonospora globispora]|uniref:HAD family hydrolase n=1 Tax=Micromonospora globispora TaxID=1450148 RepID=UPI001FAF602F|nr:HAD family hydrolase [Micromonospora globispora]